MPADQVVALDVPFKPEAAVSGGLLIQSESAVFLLFNAMSSQPEPSGYLEPKGVGILTFQTCTTTRFGYPNDEGREEHPLFAMGLSDIGYGICEVLNSTWAAEWDAMTLASAERIWGPDAPHLAERTPQRHFLVAFHDSTFECIAAGFTATVHEGRWRDAIASVISTVTGDVD
jgi:hypothetical protein